MSKKVYIKPKAEIAVFMNSDNNMLYLASGNYNGINLQKAEGNNKINLHK